VNSSSIPPELAEAELRDCMATKGYQKSQQGRCPRTRWMRLRQSGSEAADAVSYEGGSPLPSPAWSLDVVVPPGQGEAALGTYHPTCGGGEPCDLAQGRTSHTVMATRVDPQ